LNKLDLKQRTTLNKGAYLGTIIIGDCEVVFWNKKNWQFCLKSLSKLPIDNSLTICKGEGGSSVFLKLDEHRVGTTEYYNRDVLEYIKFRIQQEEADTPERMKEVIEYMIQCFEKGIIMEKIDLFCSGNKITSEYLQDLEKRGLIIQWKDMICMSPAKLEELLVEICQTEGIFLSLVTIQFSNLI
jgi:hypothetical protein